MASSHLAFCAASIAALLSLPATVAAQAADTAQHGAEAASTALASSDLSATGHFGIFTEHSADERGILLGGSLLYRNHVVAVGALAEGGTQLFGYSYGGIAALGGFALRPSTQLRFELLGSLGVHHYTGVGSGLMSDDPGASGSSGYAGARAGASWLFGDRARRFQLGMYGCFDEDLSRETVRYQYTGRSNWFGGESSVQDAEQTIGMRRTSVIASLGVTHDFL